MSKDLEKEYKALMNSEVPDLWARIEAGIDEKNVFTKQGKAPKRFRYGVWGTVAAACLCVAVAVPVMMQASKGKTDNMTAVPEAAAEAFDGGHATEDAAMKTADHDMMNDAFADSFAMEAGDTVANVAEQAETKDAGPYSKEMIRGWFDGTAEPEMDWDAEPVWTDDGALYYLPVKDQNICDLREFLSQYFDDDETEQLLNAKVGGYAPFIEVDGVLYHGAGMVGND